MTMPKIIIGTDKKLKNKHIKTTAIVKIIIIHTVSNNNCPLIFNQRTFSSLLSFFSGKNHYIHLAHFQRSKGLRRGGLIPALAPRILSYIRGGREIEAVIATRLPWGT